MRRTIHASESVLIRAPQERVRELYTRWQGWPRLFPDTIRGVRLVRAQGNTSSIEVEHVEGLVPNELTIVSPELVVLEERKRRYDARFENRFERTPEGTRYVVAADVELRGLLRALALVARPFIRARIRRYVLEPMRHAAESASGRCSSVHGCSW